MSATEAMQGHPRRRNKVLHRYFYTITGDRNLSENCDWVELEKGEIEAASDALDLTKPGTIEQFRKWQAEDGTKEGLEQLSQRLDD